MNLKFIQFSTLAAVFCMLVACTGTKEPIVAKEELPAPNIIPLPLNVSWDNGTYLVPQANKICYNDGAKTSAVWLQKLLNSAGLNSEISAEKNSACGNWTVVKEESLDLLLGEEGYILDVRNNGVTLKAATDAGLFYAVQTLRQFFPAEIEQNNLSNTAIKLRLGHIEDTPQYSWRGTMVDVSRSFFGLEYLKQHVDRMALYKMNRLHLHLTDDQGWRIEIKSKPKLTKVASKGSVTDGRSGYLTQEEYKDLQDYALARNIIIIPEIDMPGHIYSALLAYPELNCSENTNINPKKAVPPALYEGYEVGWSKFCLEKPETYEFVAEVIEELADITKGPWIHMGGDEIKDPLYKEFVVKADSIINFYNKITIGWEEVTQAKVSENFISQVWNGDTESVIKDVKVIESICSNFYLDHGNTPDQENAATWCKKDGVSLNDVYDYSNSNPNVIGVEAPVWTEYVLTDETMDDRFWPRAVAVAEIGWTPDAKRDFSGFIKRLSDHGKRLSQMGIHFFPSPEVKWGDKEDPKEVKSVFYNFDPKK